jgi:hypothetical protein
LNGNRKVIPLDALLASYREAAKKAYTKAAGVRHRSEIQKDEQKRLRSALRGEGALFSMLLPIRARSLAKPLREMVK